jgi:heme oxygenase
MMARPSRRLAIIDLTATGLASRLRLETQDLHRQSERSGFMAALLRGHLDRPGYAALLLNLQAIYAALEAGLARLTRASDIDFTPLHRSAALDCDLQHLAVHAVGDDALRPATRRYVQRLQALTGAHAPCSWRTPTCATWVTCTAGRCCASGCPACFGLTDTRGTSFYEFGPPDQVRQLIQGFRAGLDAWPADAAEADALVAEARLAFSCTSSCSANCRIDQPPRRSCGSALYRAEARCAEASTSLSSGATVGSPAIGDVHGRQAGVGEDGPDHHIGVPLGRLQALLEMAPRGRRPLAVAQVVQDHDVAQHVAIAARHHLGTQAHRQGLSVIGSQGQAAAPRLAPDLQALQGVEQGLGLHETQRQLVQRGRHDALGTDHAIEGGWKTAAPHVDDGHRLVRAAPSRGSAPAGARRSTPHTACTCTAMSTSATPMARASASSLVDHGIAVPRTISDQAANERRGESSSGLSATVGLLGSPAQVTVSSCSLRSQTR